MHSLLDLKLAEQINRDRLYGIADRPAPARAAVLPEPRRWLGGSARRRSR